MNRRQYLAAVGVSCTAAVSGCSGGDGQSNQNGETDSGDGQTGGTTTSSADVPTVEVGTAGGGSTGVLMDIAVGEGLDKENGVNVKRVEGSPPKTFQLLANKGVKVSMFGVAAAATAQKEGKNISIFGPWLKNHNSLMVQPDAEIESWHDLKGKRLGILPPSSAQYNAAQVRVSQLDGLRLTEDFDLRTGGPGAIHALNKKDDVDAHLGFIPVSVKALVSETFREIEYFPPKLKELFGRNLHYVGAAAWDGWLEKNPDSARAIRKALIDAATLLNEEPVKTLGKYQSSSGYENEEQVKFAAKRTPAVYPTKWSDEQRSNIEDQLGKMKELGAISKDAPVDVTANI